MGLPAGARAQTRGDRAGRGASEPADLFRNAYAWVEAGDSFLGQSLADEAFESYLDALSGYERLAREHPQWNPDVVAFRIQYCRRQLERILSGRTEPLPEKPARDGWVGLQWSSSLLEDVPEARPTGFESSLKAAAAREKKGELEPALALYEQALNLNPASLAAAHGAGRCCLGLGLVKRGRDLLLAAFARDPDNVDTILLLASLACAERDFNRALRTLTPFAQQHPDHPRVRFLLGSAHMGLGHLDQAEAEWRKAVALDPRFSEAHYNLARLLLLQNPADLAGAREHYRLSLQAGGERDEHLEKLFTAAGTQTPTESNPPKKP
jgi:tetratricopeptide (TPR) repeat protein